MKNKAKKILAIFRHVKQNPYLINKFLNETKHFGVKNALKKVKSKTNFNTHSIQKKKPECTFMHSGDDYEIKVSVIIPTYNRSALLPSLLESWREVNKVTKYKYEIIFSDDGSEDGSVEILEQAKDLPLKVLKNNHGGAAKARNSAILAAKGEKLYIIGDDIFPNPQIINQHYEKLQELPICKAVLGEIVWHKDLTINTLMKHITELGNEQFSFNAFNPYEYIDFRHFYTSNISIDKEFLLSEKIIFDEIFNKYGYEDIELGYRLYKKGMEIYYYPDATVEHFHPYTEVKNFCYRQENAGAMALVFKKLHKDEIEWVVQVEQISIEWKKYISSLGNSKSIQTKVLEKTIEFCQVLEDNEYISKYNLEKEISNIYRLLFRFYYEKGIVENSYQLDEKTINLIFAKYFLPQIISFVEKINVFVPFDFINDILVEKNEQKISLIIEIDSFENIDIVKEFYKDCINEVLIKVKSDVKELDNNYIYRPQKGFYLHPSNLKQLILFIQNNSAIDYILLSFGLCDLPNIGMSEALQNHFIFKNNGIRIDDIKSKKYSGKVIRLLSEKYISKINIDGFINRAVDNYGFWNKKKEGIIEKEISYFNHNVYMKTTKKVIFVFPIFLAVGGVERNTAEIISALKNEYDFVVVNFERLNESLGNLHHQFIENSLAIYDLTELSSHKSILNYLKILNLAYSPDLIWICNGSPWLEHNLGSIRSIFEKSAIVDQQVYDMNEGWVRLYKEKNPALLSFERFIAINSKIEDVFVNEADIPIENVDLIYSVMSDTKRYEALKSSKEELCQKYNLDINQKYIVSIGRLTHQKAPLDLINLIKKVINKYDSEYRFIIVGSGELSSKMDEVIKNQQLEDYIVRFEYIDNTYELDIISEAIIFTSLYEGLSIALLEALSIGTPGISTDVGDTKLIFDKYKNGIIFNRIGDIDEYFSIFSNFIDNYDEYKNNALLNKDKVAKMFSKDTIVRQYIQSFEKAIAMKVN